jgi:hypothetical protein
VTVHNTKGEKSDFTKAWEVVWDDAIRDCANSKEGNSEKLGLERIRNFFNTNPAINKESISVMEDMLHDVQRGYDLSSSTLKLIRRMERGDMPTNQDEKKFKVN